MFWWLNSTIASQTLSCGTGKPKFCTVLWSCRAYAKFTAKLSKRYPLQPGHNFQARIAELGKSQSSGMFMLQCLKSAISMEMSSLWSLRLLQTPGWPVARLQLWLPPLSTWLLMWCVYRSLLLLLLSWQYTCAASSFLTP